MHLIDVLKESRKRIAEMTYLHMGEGQKPFYPKLLEELDAHIARLESPELVEAVAISIEVTYDASLKTQAKAAIDAVLGV